MASLHVQGSIITSWRVWFYPVASFTVTPITEIAPLKVVFIDTSTGMTTSWSWNFVDKTSLTYHDKVVTKPAHTYSNAGEYIGSMTVSNTTGSNTTTFRVVVQKIWLCCKISGNLHN